MPVDAYHRPTTLEEALDLTAAHDSLEVVSGGTITMPAVNEGRAFPSHVVDLRGLGLDHVESADGALTIGATVTLTDVLDRVDVPILRTAARHTGGWAVRNMGTVGGNLFAPPPLGDFAVALLALDAAVGIRGPDGERRVPLSEFYAGADGHALDHEELVTEVVVPAVAGETAYRKYTRVQEPAPPVVTVAARLERDGDGVDEARIAVNGAGPHPVRLRDAEAALTGSALDGAAIDRAAEAAAEEADPVEDAVASEWYRRRMIRTYVRRTLERIAGTDADADTGASDR